ncbi:MAG: adenylosuccinate lyase [Myxococcales bacterium]|nr:adenylosuccinate lyase [Myxococcota bacterium]MDW8284109.1 adenylosuccinate lyase [Myxococcales bacterium]
MVPRYARKEMLALWSDERRLATWLEVELCACAAMERVAGGPIPPGTAERLRQAAAAAGPLDLVRIREIEAETQHDIVAFLTYLEERLGPEARFLHLGLTSSDVLDTALALLLCQAIDLILDGLRGRLLPALRHQALRHRRTPLIGRTHGMHAEPITAGLVFASSYAELDRAARRLQASRTEIAVGKLAGAVGVYGSGVLSPQLELEALAQLGLVPETVATQVVARDRHAALFAALALLGAGIERLAMTVRHWQRTEVGEAEEPFGARQKGSSAMPHKKNPVLSENLCGLARLLRAGAGAALENIALWHERDISHSSVERVLAPDMTTLADFMVHRAATIVEGLTLHPERMQQHLQQSLELCASEKVLLELVARGLPRGQAYEIVQRHALGALAGGAGLRARLHTDPEVASRIPPSVLDACFDLQHHLRHVDAILARVFGPEVLEGP